MTPAAPAASASRTLATRSAMLWTRTAEPVRLHALDVLGDGRAVAERQVEDDDVDLAAGEVVDELLDAGRGEDDVEALVLAGRLDAEADGLVVVDDGDADGRGRIAVACAGGGAVSGDGARRSGATPASVVDSGTIILRSMGASGP